MGAGEREKASHLVVVGSSAGGIEALTTLLASLPSELPAAVVIAQHLDPARPSHLPAILERRTALPVVLVEKRTPLQHGTVYVVPANQHVVIEDGQVNLEGDHAERPRPSVDLLLSSAARSFGEQLIAVILTGSGSDGAAGAVDVKAAGGVVVIQNPATAAHPSMPLALPPTVVDHVSDLDGIGPLIQGLLQAPLPGDAHDQSPEVVPALLDLVSRHAGIDFQAYKPATIVRRVARRMAALKLRSLAEYHDQLQQNPAEIGELARSFLIRVTEFFRDPEAFEYLRREILPPLIEAGRGRGKVLRMWSAGCATGEEAFSLALLVSELLAAELSSWNVRIFATDLDEEAVTFARRGVYPSSVLRYVPGEYRERHFERVGPSYRVRKTLRDMVIFGQQDLARGAPFPRIDLVVCRNLLIYFKPELQQDLLDLFAYSLSAANGYLFLGKAETARPARGSFDLVNKKWKVYRCVSGPRTAPPVRAAPLSPARPRRLVDASDPAARADPKLELLHVRQLNELVLRHVPTGIVLLDRSYRILSLNAIARRLLGIREPATDSDFLHAVRSLPYAAIREAIDGAFRDKTIRSVAPVEVEGESAHARFVTLQVAPVVADTLAIPETVVVSVTDSTETVELRQLLEKSQKDQRELVTELGGANERLKRTNAELQEANDELQRANEELLLAQEELQATNEEFEATNEELQATNEELETNNEELQATNEELEATNEELTARTADLQEMASSLAVERARLHEMVSVAPFSILILRGRALRVEAANEKSGGLLGHAAAGRTFEEICASPQLQPVLAGVRQAYASDCLWISEAIPAIRPDRRDSTFIFTAVPSHDEAGSVTGVVLYGREELEA